VRAWQVLVLATAMCGGLVGCGGPKPKQVGDPKTGDDIRQDDRGDVDQKELGEPADPDIATGEGKFDEEAANICLNRGAKKAAECAKVNLDIPKGEGSVDVVFDGAKGRVVDVNLGSSYTSTSPLAQQCLKNAFIGEILPPFRGSKTVPFTFKIQ
jgi:hypothetical protein